jgi:hypothetical protein
MFQVACNEPSGLTVTVRLGTTSADAGGTDNERADRVAAAIARRVATVRSLKRTPRAPRLPLDEAFSFMVSPFFGGTVDSRARTSSQEVYRRILSYL